MFSSSSSSSRVRVYVLFAFLLGVDKLDSTKGACQTFHLINSLHGNLIE